MVVGSEEKAFSVHENLIRASSIFFDKALSGNWKESHERVIKLPEDEPEVFAIYVHWLYFRTFAVFRGKPDALESVDHLRLAKAFVLGDKLLDQEVQDAVMDAFVESMSTPDKNGHLWYPTGPTVGYAYENTNSSAPIRELLLDASTLHSNSSWYRQENSAEYPQPFLLELVARLLDRKSSPESLDPSKYHYRGHRGNSS